MISLPLRAFLYIAQPILSTILKEIANSAAGNDALGNIKRRLYELAADLTGKSSFTWDDDLAKQILDTLSNEGLFKQFGDALLDIAEEWIKNTETQWDDSCLQPVISTLRAIAGIPDGKD